MEIETSDSNLPLVNVILRSWYTGKIWEFLRENIPQFQLEEESSEETTTADLTTTTTDSNVNEIKSESPTVLKSRGTDLHTHCSHLSINSM